MSFEMKYDRDGSVIKTEQPIIAQPQPEQQQQQSESQEPASLEEPQSEPEVAEVPVEQPKPKEDSYQVNNFRELRAQADQAKRERDELMRRLIEVEAQRSSHDHGEPEAIEEDNEINLAPDDLAEGKHLTKVGREIKKLKQELNQYKSQSQTATTEIRLKAQYPDFDNVVSKENLELLKMRHPELANTLMSSGADLYSKGVSAYSLIKNMGIVSQAPVNNFEEEKALAQKNATKPRSSISLSPQQGESPLHRANAFANGLTPELKAQLRKEMEDARKNR